MLKFALKNMAIKKVQIILVVISIVISAGIAVLAFNVSNQVSQGLTENTPKYSLIIGSRGSKTQLAMNTLFFVDEPLDSIPYTLVNEIKTIPGANIEEVIPFAMADSYAGYKVVGTTDGYFGGYTLKEGKLFGDDTHTAVVGYNVAKAQGLEIGEVIYTSHGANGHMHDGENQGITVVGILDRTHSAFDNTVFTNIETLWALHGIGEHDEEHQEEHVAQTKSAISLLTATNEPTHGEPSHGGDHDTEGDTGKDESSGENEHEEHEKTVSAILVKTDGLASNGIITEIYKDAVNIEGKSYFLQAINPDETIRTVKDDTDNTKAIVYVLCGVILIMNVMVITIITILNMYHSTKEIALMRLIGISAGKINLLYVIENAIIGFISVILAFGVSRFCLLFMNEFVASWGIVINMSRVSLVEILILLGVFIISVLPTAICTVIMSKRDSIGG